MKNKVRIIGAGLLALLLTLTGCSNPLNARPEAAAPQEAVSGGKIVIQLDDSNARTLGPVAEDKALLKYRLIIQSGSKTIEEDVEFTGAVERNIDSGNWTVGVFAYLDDYEDVAWAEQSIYLKDGETKVLPLTLLPLSDEDVAGTFDYDIAFPEAAGDFDYAATTLVLTPGNYNSASTGTLSINLQDYGKGADMLELPSGKYDLNITLQSTRQVNSTPLKVVVKETVYIYPRLTTRAHYAFTMEHFTADVYLKGSAWVTSHTSNEYKPTEVQLKLFDDGDYDDTNIQTAPVTGDDETGYGWDLPVSSEKVGGAGNVSGIQLRLVVTSQTDATQKLTGPWQTYYLNTPQGNTGINLSTNVYAIVKAPASANFAGFQGVSGIAHNSDFIPGTEGVFRIVPNAKYGLIGNSVSITNGYTTLEDGSFGFVNNGSNANMTVSAQFFHLKGTAVITSVNADNYKPTKVEAFEEKENGEQKLIGETTTIAAAGGAWEISVPNAYVSTDTGYISFKVTSGVTGKPNQDYVFKNAAHVYSLTTDASVVSQLSVPLFAVSNFRQTGAALTSVTLSWDVASWATGGYKIYRNGTLINSPAAGSYTYTNTGLTAGTTYFYEISGIVSGTPAVEGEKTGFYATTKLTAPLNVNAVTAATDYDPFRTSITWDPVTGADYYEVYRNGERVYPYYVYGASYDDSYGKMPGEEYTYKVVAKSYSGDYATSAESVPATVSFPLYGTLTGGYNYGYINSGEYNYWRFDVSSSGYYRVYLGDYSVDAYAYVYRNGEYITTLDSSSIESYLYPGDEVVVAVRAHYSGNTGDYYINAEQLW
jgi:hypothetical protein